MKGPDRSQGGWQPLDPQGTHMLQRAHYPHPRQRRSSVDAQAILSPSTTCSSLGEERWWAGLGWAGGLAGCTLPTGRQAGIE